MRQRHWQEQEGLGTTRQGPTPVAHCQGKKKGDGDVVVDVVAVADALHRLRIQFKFQVFGSVSTESQPH